MTVNQIRKSSKDEEVISLSKTLIKNWKKFLSGSKDSSTSTSSSKSKKEKEDKSDKEDKEQNKEKKLQNQFPTSNSNTRDAVRLKCREMLAAAISSDADDFEGKFSMHILEENHA